MKVPSLLASRIVALTAVAVVAPFLPSAKATVVAQDPFTDGGRTDGTDPLDMAWYTFNTASSTLAVVSDTGGINTGNALQFAPNGTFQGIVANLPSLVALNDGESVRLTFDYRYVSATNLNQSARLRFGLYNSNGTYTTADSQSTPRTNDLGYFAVTNPGVSDSSSTLMYREIAGDEITQGTNTALSGAGAAINAGTTPHTAELILTRRDGTLTYSASLDGYLPVAGIDTAPSTYAFDEVALSCGSGTTPPAIRLDNVQVERYYSLISETFDDGVRMGGSAPGDTDWWGINTPSLSVVDDSAGIGEGDALQISPSSNNGQGVVARFGAPGVVSLADGDSVTFAFVWRFTGTTNTNGANIFRFGLHNANATVTVSDNNTSSRTDDVGYFAATNPGAASSTGTIVAREAAGPEILQGPDWAAFGTAGASVSGGTTPHFATLTIRRSGTSLVVSSSIDGQALASGTDASPVSYVFSEAAVAVQAATSPFIIDDLRVEYSPATVTPPAETVGGGTVSSPAVGPIPAYGIGGTGFTLVKNWDFGGNGTIKTISDLSTNFQYHDQFGTINNGGNYGASIVSPDSAHALSGQPVEGVNTTGNVRSILADSMKTYLVPLNGATTVTPASHNAGCGSFQAKWTLPNGGSLLNQDIVWETRVRYVTPQYFWFAIWTSGNQWNNGAEMDLIESFGYDNGGGFTNFDGRYWHSNSVGGSDATSYSNWGNSMAVRGIPSFDATQYHIWTWLYRKDNTYTAYVDGVAVQNGTINWTLSGISGGTPLNMSFLFDAGWGHTKVSSVNHSLAASALAGTYYEWDYSRVYLK